MLLDYPNFFPSRNKRDVAQTENCAANFPDVEFVKVIKIVGLDIEEETIYQDSHHA